MGKVLIKNDVRIDCCVVLNNLCSWQDTRGTTHSSMKKYVGCQSLETKLLFNADDRGTDFCIITFSQCVSLILCPSLPPTLTSSYLSHQAHHVSPKKLTYCHEFCWMNWESSSHNLFFSRAVLQWSSKFNWMAPIVKTTKKWSKHPSIVLKPSSHYIFPKNRYADPNHISKKNNPMNLFKTFRSITISAFDESWDWDDIFRFSKKFANETNYYLLHSQNFGATNVFS